MATGRMSDTEMIRRREGAQLDPVSAPDINPQLQGVLQDTWQTCEELQADLFCGNVDASKVIGGPEFEEEIAAKCQDLMRSIADYRRAMTEDTTNG